MARILVACEFSGIVRDAFAEKGHDAWSCDLLPTERPGNHIQGDVLNYLDGLPWSPDHDEKIPWDLMIAHPPCTYISYAGTSSWNNPGRIKLRLEALDFFRQLWEAPIEKICLENPKSCASPVIAKYSQIIQPYYFGDSDMKTTWLWLKNLPKLIHREEDTLFEIASHVDKPQPLSIDNTERAKKRYFTDGPSRDPYIRAKTFHGIANAMADQWSNL